MNSKTSPASGFVARVEQLAVTLDGVPHEGLEIRVDLPLDEDPQARRGRSAGGRRGPGPRSGRGRCRRFRRGCRAFRRGRGRARPGSPGSRHPRSAEGMPPRWRPRRRRAPRPRGRNRRPCSPGGPGTRRPWRSRGRTCRAQPPAPRRRSPSATEPPPPAPRGGRATATRSDFAAIEPSFSWNTTPSRAGAKIGTGGRCQVRADEERRVLEAGTDHPLVARPGPRPAGGSRCC